METFFIQNNFDNIPELKCQLMCKKGNSQNDQARKIRSQKI